MDSLKELDLNRPIREEIWFADEARVGQKNKITHRWAKNAAPSRGALRYIVYKLLCTPPTEERKC